ncbi:MAG: ABC transporter permease subunit, partial [Thermoguttaceae bacterium]|nr:ABC transporter permease subunit [Thermoguttaceae bacterium]
LGANGWQIFTRVTLPNVKWALLYGAILCNARAMGEFGAVSVVAGKVAKTNTAPLHIEDLQQSYAKGAEPFAVASLLAAAAILTLVAKAVLEWKMSRSDEE